MESRKFLAVIVGAVALLGQALSAAPIVAIDYDTITATQGTLVSGPTVGAFTTPGLPGQPTDAGTVTNTVFFNDTTDLYTYVHAVAPANGQNFSTFFTSFAPLGFNGVAGYSFSQAASAGVVFEVLVSDTNGSLNWEATAANAWNAGETITFFFQSDIAPTDGGIYNRVGDVFGSALSFQPIPAPAALYGGVLLMGVVIATRWRRRG